MAIGTKEHVLYFLFARWLIVAWKFQYMYIYIYIHMHVYVLYVVVIA